MRAFHARAGVIRYAAHNACETDLRRRTWDPSRTTARNRTITDENPAGTDGFEFVEFAHPEPATLRELFAKMGYIHTATHKTKAVELWQQGDITYVLNAEPGSFASRFVTEHGPCAPSMAWRVVDAEHALKHAVANGAEEYTGTDKTMDVPAIVGIGGSLIYFVDQYYETPRHTTRNSTGSTAPIPRAWASTTWTT
jgi:4-hydroxyphenylpyruvate dioxygenase-like putative hemolysin